MADTYTLIEKITVGAAGATDVTFTSIPQTYTDLKIVISGRTNRGGAFEDSLKLQLGSTGSVDTGNNYTSIILQQYNNTVSSAAETNVGYITCYSIFTAASATTSTFGNAEIYIPNYTSSNAKSVSIDGVSETNNTQGSNDMAAGLWTGTGAINVIKVFPYFGSFVQYTTFYLYGIAKEGVNPSLPSAPYATGGDSILFDGTYWIHTFRSSGTFTPKKSLSCDYLVVAGGGGGGYQQGGGGGAGGLRSTVTATGGGGSLESALSLTANTGYTVTIGAGAAGMTSGSGSTSSGSNSSISGTGITTITSTGGGGGASNVLGNGASGGSGGGAGATALNTNYTGGAGTANQGYAGGNASGQPNNYATGAGGGGAGAVGQSTSPGNYTVGGNGGNGVAVAITGSSVTYAGGGGGGSNGTGGTGGTGGAGNGSGNNTTAASGTANTGSGGGGGGQAGGTPPFGSGGAGGSGIVIVRYAA